VLRSYLLEQRFVTGRFLKKIRSQSYDFWIHNYSAGVVVG
jgi:hypothetical protein